MKKPWRPTPKELVDALDRLCEAHAAATEEWTRQRIKAITEK